MNEINRMDVAEFRKLGYLQEVNRQMLHPLGLALAVVVEEDGTERLDDVWDYRHDPEGVYFDDLAAEDVERGKRIAVERAQRSLARVKALGYLVQPLKADTTP